jgi:hypothetical protein
MRPKNINAKKKFVTELIPLHSRNGHGKRLKTKGLKLFIICDTLVINLVLIIKSFIFSLSFKSLIRF